MKKVILILLLVCVKTISHAQSIEQTLAQISELKLEIENNESLVNEKIETLKNTNPMFAEQDPFESDAEYLGRMSTAMPAFDSIRKEHLGDKWGKMSILRGRMFETSDITIVLDAQQYDANTEKWPITVTHNQHQQESFPVTLAIKKDDARAFHANWEKVKKTGILTIDVGDKIGLAKFILFDPISGLKFSHEFKPMLEFSGKKPLFSNNGKWLFYCNKERNGGFSVRKLSTGKSSRLSSSSSYNSGGFHTLSVNNDIYVISNSRTLSVKKFPSGDAIYNNKSSGGGGPVAISPDGKFVAKSIDSDDYYRSDKVSILNLETQKWIMELEAPSGTDNLEFNPGGNLLLISGYSQRKVIYNLETQEVLKQFESDVKAVSFHPNINAICYATKNGITIKSLDDWKTISYFAYSPEQTHIGSSLVFSFDGKYIAVSGKNTTYIYNISDAALPTYTKKHFPIRNNIAFSPDNQYIVGTFGSKTKMYRTFLNEQEDIIPITAQKKPKPPLPEEKVGCQVEGSRCLADHSCCGSLYGDLDDDVIEIEEDDDEEIFMVVEDPPEFRCMKFGKKEYCGHTALTKFLQKNVKYPPIAQKYNITGRVYVQFVVNKDGSVTDVKLARGVDKNLDAEAIRVVKSFPNWSPGKQRGKAVRVYFTVPIIFTLN